MITIDTGDVYAFKKIKSNLVDRVPFDVTLKVKALIMDFLLMDYMPPIMQ